MTNPPNINGLQVAEIVDGVVRYTPNGNQYPSNYNLIVYPDGLQKVYWGFWGAATMQELRSRGKQ
jgi:hypothetical protein